MTAQTSDSQESGTEQITETSGKGTNAAAWRQRQQPEP